MGEEKQEVIEGHRERGAGGGQRKKGIEKQVRDGEK